MGIICVCMLIKALCNHIKIMCLLPSAREATYTEQEWNKCDTMFININSVGGILWANKDIGMLSTSHTYTHPNNNTGVEGREG
jgi:hypothetical protein